MGPVQSSRIGVGKPYKALGADKLAQGLPQFGVSVLSRASLHRLVEDQALAGRHVLQEGQQALRVEGPPAPVDEVGDPEADPRRGGLRGLGVSVGVAVAVLVGVAGVGRAALPAGLLFGRALVGVGVAAVGVAGVGGAALPAGLLFGRALVGVGVGVARRLRRELGGGLLRGLDRLLVVVQHAQLGHAHALHAAQHGLVGDPPEGGGHDGGLGVERAHYALQQRELLLGDHVHFVQHQDVGALHLLDE
mmetsp:Transcript_1/g.2  ORF Transcript_1/g.2 Transcript_1/m.2 type:complete len:248 (-) Transcript_1:866-1609(-)